MFPAFVMAAVCCTPLAARSLGDHFEGEWIWDRAQSVSPPNVGEVNPLAAETMLVTRDDGVRFKGGRGHAD